MLLGVLHRAAACTNHGDCDGDTYCDMNNVCWTCVTVRGNSFCDAVDNDCSTPCGDTDYTTDSGGGDLDSDDMDCAMEAFVCLFDSECLEILSACGTGCEHSLEPLRDNGCCSNDACYNFHECSVNNGLVSDDETCDEYNIGPILVALLVLLALSIAAIACCSYFCCCRKQPQHTSIQNTGQAQQQQQPQQNVVMAVPVGQPQPQFNVTVPPGVQPGQSLQVQSPTTGMALLVQVPAGYQPGMTFAVAG